ncbi:MAG: CoA pyrophosphatase [Gemmatimonadaceae bacterium]
MSNAALPDFETELTEQSESLKRTLASPVIVRLLSALGKRSAVDALLRDGEREAAVLALVRMAGENNERAELLFIKRAVYNGDPWSGHIAFPGGRRDAADESLSVTALRETWEELALDVMKLGKLVGRVDDLAPRTPALPPIIIRPFIGVVPVDTLLTPNAEVAEAFWVSVAELKLESTRIEHVFERSGETLAFPAFKIREHVIWGLTERIVTQLLPLFDGAE